MNVSKSITVDYIRKYGNTLDVALDAVSVIGPGEIDGMPEGWYSVSNPDGVIAGFANETDAFSFRLNYINSILNP